jgi:CBS domain containing-hemolysin-like protein
MPAPAPVPVPDSTPPAEPSPPAGEPRNLPAVVPLLDPAAREDGESWFARVLRAIFHWKAGTIRSDLKDVLDAGARETGFSPKESAMLKNILGLHERRVDDVMVPRADIVAVQQDIVLGELIKVFAHAVHSRLVVYEETLDDAIGMVHIRDLIAFMAAGATDAGAQANAKRKKPLPAGLDLNAIDLATPLSQTRIVRDMLFAPPSMPVLDLLAKMQTTRIHLALVVDEYGGTDGVVSMEDIVEQIVGEIADEHDEDEPVAVVRQPDGSYLADARASLEDASAIIGPEFEVGEVANEVDTLAGYIATRIGRVPVRGELVPGPGRFEIEVLDADPRRVKKLKIYRSADRPNGGNGEAPRRAGATPPAAAPPTASPRAPQPDLPLAPEASAELSPDASPAQASRRP